MRRRLPQNGARSEDQNLICRVEISDCRARCVCDGSAIDQTKKRKVIKMSKVNQEKTSEVVFKFSVEDEKDVIKMVLEKVARAVCLSFGNRLKGRSSIRKCEVKEYEGKQDEKVKKYALIYHYAERRDSDCARDVIFALTPTIEKAVEWGFELAKIDIGKLDIEKMRIW